jgi:hypothetical protein
MLQNRGNVFRRNSGFTKRTQKSIYAICSNGTPGWRRPKSQCTPYAKGEIFSNLSHKHMDINSVHNGKTINFVPRKAIQLLKAIKHYGNKIWWSGEEENKME